MLKNLVPRWYPEKKLIPERYRFSSKYLISFREMARVTGLEPATSGVTEIERIWSDFVGRNDISYTFQTTFRGSNPGKIPSG